MRIFHGGDNIDHIPYSLTDRPDTMSLQFLDRRTYSSFKGFHISVIEQGSMYDAPVRSLMKGVSAYFPVSYKDIISSGLHCIDPK